MCVFACLVCACLVCVCLIVRLRVLVRVRVFVSFVCVSISLSLSVCLNAPPLQSSLVMEVNTSEHKVECVTGGAPGLSPDTLAAVEALLSQLTSIQALSLQDTAGQSAAMLRWKRVRLAVTLFGLPFFSTAAQKK